MVLCLILTVLSVILHSEHAVRLLCGQMNRNTKANISSLSCNYYLMCDGLC